MTGRETPVESLVHLVVLKSPPEMILDSQGPVDQTGRAMRRESG